MGTADTLLGACIFFGMAGLGSSGMWSPMVAVVQRWFSIRRRGMALGILSVGFGLGYANMGLVFPWIVNNFSWRYSWYFLGAGALILVAANWLLLRSDPDSSGYRPWGEEGPQKAAQTEATEPGSTLTTVWAFRQSAFWFIGLSYLCIAYAVYGFGTFLIDFARHQLGWSLEHSSFLATISGIGQVAGVLIIMPLSDYMGRKKTLLLSHFVITCVLTAVLAAGDTRLVIYALVGLMSFFMGAVFPLYGASAGDYFPKHMMATIMGVWTPFYGLGAVMVHWITGVLRDTQGNYIHAFILCAVSAFMAFLLMLPVRKPNF
jgi:sugar phosphate permease